MRSKSLLMAGVTPFALLIVTPAHAQTVGSNTGANESEASNAEDENRIVVTARRRQEALSDAPLSIAVVRGDDLNKTATNDFSQLSTQVPQLQIGAGAGATGATVTLRGIGSGSFNANTDQAVSTNIDGIQISKALVARQAFFDLEQIELLKGPQALFFGKNSPGGIIALKTANPTSSFEGYVRTGYSFDQDQITTQAAVSGPIGDGLAARAAVLYSNGDGYYTNNSIAQVRTLEDITSPEEFVGRLTLSYDDGPLAVLAKYSYAETNSTGRGSLSQRFVCPDNNLFRLVGIQAEPSECDIDRRTSAPTTTAQYLSFLPTGPSNGEPFEETESHLLALDITYEFGGLSLNSITGYYDVSNTFRQNSSSDFATLPNTSTSLFVGTFSKSDYSSFTQELRLTSDFDGPFQFMIGGLYQDERNNVVNDALLDATGALTAFGLGPMFGGVVPPGTGITVIQPSNNIAESEAISVFAQVQYDLTNTVNLSIGGRYTSEDKSFDKIPIIVPGAMGGTPPLGGLVPGQTFLSTDPAFAAVLNRTFNDFSPEATLTFKPTADQTYYLSYKQGFKSGNFNSSILIPTSVNDLEPVRPEEVEGFELGAKFVLDEGRLLLNLGAYYYDYTDLQTTFLVLTTLREINAEEARVRGLELDFSWRPASIPGLELIGAINYNDAEYQDFQTACFAAQTIDAGCNLDFSPFANQGQGGFTNQDLSGEQLLNAPEWTGRLGFDYTGDIGSTGWTFGLLGAVSYTSEFQPHDSFDPRAIQDDATRFDAGISVASPDDRFELSLIGKNLTEVVRATFVQSPPLEAVGTGTPFANPTDLIGFFSPPRTVVLQGTFRF